MNSGFWETAGKQICGHVHERLCRFRLTEAGRRYTLDMGNTTPWTALQAEYRGEMELRSLCPSLFPDPVHTVASPHPSLPHGLWTKINTNSSLLNLLLSQQKLRKTGVFSVTMWHQVLGGRKSVWISDKKRCVGKEAWELEAEGRTDKQQCLAPKEVVSL